MRPSPTGSIRPFWNFLHHNLGRITVLSAWATLYMGIYMAHTSVSYQVSELCTPWQPVPLVFQHLPSPASSIDHAPHITLAHLDGPSLRPPIRRGLSPRWL